MFWFLVCGCSSFPNAARSLGDDTLTPPRALRCATAQFGRDAHTINAATTISYDLLLQCNTLERDPRTRIWKEMTEGKEPGSPIPVNRAPLEADEMVTATARGIFAVSPPGTG